MNIQEIFNLGVKMGISADFRGKEAVEKNLQRKKEKYEKLPEEERDFFDKDTLANPYSDGSILNISNDKEIKKILVGIDIEPAEVLLAKEIGNIDLIISHHPLGKSLANLHEVMDMQSEVLSLYGVPINIAEDLMRERISEVARSVGGENHQQTVDVCRILKLNLMCLHSATDNLAARFLQNEINKKELARVEDVIKLLNEIPEYKEARKIGAGPQLATGSLENHCGRIAITEMTGGTEGSPKLYEKIAQAGIGTIVGMHISKESKREAESAHLNVVIAGHISSDSLGMNIFLDELEKQGIEIVPCSGLIRVKRS